MPGSAPDDAGVEPDDAHVELGIASTAEKEFDRQLATLLDRDYPRLAGMTPVDFLGQVEPLRGLLARVTFSATSSVPFLVVVTAGLVPTTAAVAQVAAGGRRGWTDMQDELDSFRPIDGLDVPAAPAYLVTDVDTGASSLGVQPNDALPIIGRVGRTPLTIDEGVALVTHLPDVLTRRNAFQALGSRAENKRIPSFWVSKGAPRLGWCWAGNPHSWLGAASAGGRYGPGEQFDRG